jgi:hypothetical protein
LQCDDVRVAHRDDPPGERPAGPDLVDPHDLSLLETTLALSVDERVRRLIGYVRFVEAGRAALRAARRASAVTDFQPAEMLRVLHEHGVRYVLIGGLAAALYGSAHSMFDVDITPDTSSDNLERLSAALRALDARIRVDGVPGGLPFAPDAVTLAGMKTLHLVTRAGDLDIAFGPAGVGAFASWDAGATDIVVLDVPIRVAALEDVVRSKEAADRDKDRVVLPLLRALVGRIRERAG